MAASYTTPWDTTNRTGWRDALNRLGVPLALGPGPETMVLNGFQPMTLKGEHLGVQVYIDDLDRLITLYPDISQITPKPHNVITFRWDESLDQVLMRLEHHPLLSTLLALQHSFLNSTSYATKQ